MTIKYHKDMLMNTPDEIGGNAGSAADKTAAVMPDNANNEDPAFAGETSDSGTGLFALLGYDASGKPVSFDLAGAAGLLIVTGLSGSSGVQDSALCSLIRRYGPEELRLLFIDNGTNQLFSDYGRQLRGIPHLLAPALRMNRAPEALRWLRAETEHRCELLSYFELKGIREFNEKARRWYNAGQLRRDPVWNYRGSREAEPPYLRPLPHILMAVDEYAYFMLSDKLRSEFESSVSYIAARGRETGIHLMLSTRHPREEIITGRIKTCFPARIVTGLESSFESRLVLGFDGGEKLPPGSMLAKLGPGYGALTELKPGEISSAEIALLARTLKEDHLPEPAPLSIFNEAAVGEDHYPAGDPLYIPLWYYCRELKEAGSGISLAAMMKKYGISRHRAQYLMSSLEKDGVVASDVDREREILDCA